MHQLTDDQRIALYDQLRDIIQTSNLRIMDFVHRGEGPSNQEFFAHVHHVKLTTMKEIEALWT